MEIKVTTSGPVFTQAPEPVVKAEINAGIRDVVQHGEGLVKAQLTPGHGVVTGHLRRSIHGGMVRDLHGQIDAGLHQQGANVDYTQFVEEGTAAHLIVPVNARVLAFTPRGGSGVVFARRVQHPGTTGLHMFQKAYEQLQRLDIGQRIGARIAKRFGGS